MRAILLALFATLMLTPALVAADQVESDNGNWLYTENVDPIDDTDRSRAVNQTSEQRRSGIVIRCDGEEYVEVFVRFGQYVGTSRSDSQEIIYRFGDEDPRQNSWSKSSDGGGAFVPHREVYDFIGLILEHDRLVVRTDDHRGTPKTLELDLTGDDGFIEDLSCVGEGGHPPEGSEFSVWDFMEDSRTAFTTGPDSTLFGVSCEPNLMMIQVDVMLNPDATQEQVADVSTDGIDSESYNFNFVPDRGGSVSAYGDDFDEIVGYMLEAEDHIVFSFRASDGQSYEYEFDLDGFNETANRLTCVSE